MIPKRFYKYQQSSVLAKLHLGHPIYLGIYLIYTFKNSKENLGFFRALIISNNINSLL